MMASLQQIPKIIKNIDYGFLGIYQHEKDRHHQLQGLICLGSHSFEEFSEELQKHNELKGFKALKVDINSDE